MKINERFPPELLQVLAHFYRAEVQRSTDWRKRLDTTTNWAIIALTATFSWAFAGSSNEDAHIIFLFTNAVIFLLLSIEARRYRHFDVWRTRVRMLEVHLLVPTLHPELDLKQGDWRESLSNDLLAPSFKISFREALAARFLANYLWIHAGLFLGWALRVIGSVERAEHHVTWRGFYEACGYRDVLPPWATLGSFAVFWIAMIALIAVSWGNRNVTGEIRRRQPGSPRWPI